MALVDTLNVGTATVGIVNAGTLVTDTINPTSPSGTVSIGNNILCYGSITSNNLLTVLGASTLAGVTATTGDFTTSITSPDILGSLDKTIDASAISIYNVKKYGATGNGTTDDTAAIQAAIAAITTAGGGTLWFPYGNYLISGTLALTGGNTNIWANGATITAASGLSTNPMFSITAGGDYTFYGVRIVGNNLGTGFSFTGGNNVYCYNCSVNDCLTSYNIGGTLISVLVEGGGVSMSSSTSAVGILVNFPGGNGDVRFTNLTIGALTAGDGTGILINSVGGAVFTNFDIINCNYAVHIQPSSGTQVTDCEFHGVTCNNSYTLGVYLDPSLGGVCSRNTFIDCNIGSENGSASGVQLGLTSGATANTVQQTRFIGCTVGLNLFNGIQVYGGSEGTLIEGCLIAGNHSNWGIITGNACGATQIIGNTFGSFYQPGGTEYTQPTDIYIQSTSTGPFTITGNMHTVNTGSSAIDQGMTTNPGIIMNNVGYNPLGGLTTPTLGASPWTYTNTTGSTVVLNLSGGTNTSISLGMPGNLKPFANPTSSGGTYLLAPGMQVQITYSSAPLVESLMGY